jgi:hypothetical protein
MLESGELTFSTRRLALMNAFRTLADVDNRGKLNIAEFHVAVGLIYRSMRSRLGYDLSIPNIVPELDGHDIPDELPADSHHDLDTSANFVKNLLPNGPSRARSPSSSMHLGSQVRRGARTIPTPSYSLGHVVSKPPPAPPAKSPAANVKSMTPEGRRAFVQAEAQRRIAERMAAMGPTATHHLRPSRPSITVLRINWLARRREPRRKRRQQMRRLQNVPGNGASD